MAPEPGGPSEPLALVIAGTRPEVIKMAPVVAALRARGEEIRTRVAFTGQHVDLADQALSAFDFEPDWELGIMRPDQSLYDVAEGCLRGVGDVVRECRPDVVLVQGDTATVFFTSLVGFFERIRVGHVEAGLRSGEKWSPYPEEVFRRLTDDVADFHFAPTRRAREHLLAEDVPPDGVHVTGNTVVDALRTIGEEAGPPGDPVLRSVVEGPRRMVLLTAHRRESFGAPIREIFRAVRTLADRYDDVDVVYPVHPNPNVTGPAEAILSDHPRIHLLEPVPYLDLIAVLREATLVLTDSGGIQEEAPTFGVPVLVLREVTERPEGIDAGVARLVGTDGDRIVREGSRVLDDPPEGVRTGAAPNPYGDGRAGERIADIVIAELSGRERRTSDWDAP